MGEVSFLNGSIGRWEMVLNFTFTMILGLLIQFPLPLVFLQLLPNLYMTSHFFYSGSNWIHNRLTTVFTPTSVSHILQIPLTTSNVPDRIIGHFTSNGLFSVMSTYHLDHKLLREANTRHTHYSGPFIQDKSFWI
ncbi:hypothetical protein LINPERPRIM_LOCUS26138 [Linum perenne]